MKTLAYLAMAVLIIEGCNTKQAQQIKSLSTEDSTLMRESGKKDSTILAYVKSMNDIQDNLDSIKASEKILSVGAFGSENKHTAVQDIRNINAQLLKYHREIYTLEKKLRSIDSKNKEIQKMETHLAQELAEKDSGIAVLQKRLAGMNDSLRTVINQFNDSMVVINRQKSAISDMTTQIHTVYYAIGTIKEFKKNGVITREGGFAGIGRNTEMKQDFNANYFAKDDMTKLNILPLNSKFEKLVTTHPKASYMVTNNSKADSLIIKDPVLFWSVSKYLVVVVK
ncbi:MAG TPA: hypothetical protein VN922_01455 [Bacteroidia bacterium]|nr:hypothetical protein [Bacteroidia bacterium]